MTLGARKQDVELECFLEIQGATGPHCEEVAAAVAEEVEEWIGSGNLDGDEAEAALELARQLRLLGWLMSVDLGGDRVQMMEQLELLVSKANELMIPPIVSGVRRKFTPPMALPLAHLYGAEDDEATVVKKARWDLARSTNRIFKKDGGSDPPPKE